MSGSKNWFIAYDSEQIYRRTPYPWLLLYRKENGTLWVLGRFYDRKAAEERLEKEQQTEKGKQMTDDNQNMQLQKRESITPQAYSPQEVLKQTELVQQIMRSVMKKDEHYGTIPGCGDKNVLFKAGAEKLVFTFRMAPKYDVRRYDLPNGHREYEVVCSLYSIQTGQFLGQGVGSCSTMEAKYRFRVEATGKPVPKEYWEKGRDPALLGGPDYIPKKINGQWMILRRIEHDNPADHHNTCLKIGKKRASSDATLTATAASDIFGQDMEDIRDNMAMYGDVVDVETSQPAKPDWNRQEAKQPDQPARPAPQPAPAASRKPPEKPAEEPERIDPTGGDRLPASQFGSPEEALQTAWATQVHFGKNQGKALNELQSNALNWYINKWVPRDYPEGSGKFKEKDLWLRRALNEIDWQRRTEADRVADQEADARETQEDPKDDLPF